MHTEAERKFLVWAEFCRMIVLLEAVSIDSPADGNFDVDPFARECAHYIGSEYILDWVRAQEGWKGNSGPATWVNTNRRSKEEVADAIREVVLRWIDDDCPQALAALGIPGGSSVDRFGMIQGVVKAPRRNPDLTKEVS